MELIKHDHLSMTTHEHNVPTAPVNEGHLTLTFRIGSQQYGLPVTAVIEIVRLPALVSLAGSPPIVIGLINLRGKYLPVLDGSILIGEEPQYDLSNQIVIAGCTHNNNLIPVFGLRVDQVLDVRTLYMNRLTKLGTSISALFLKGVIKAEQDAVLMMDIDVLLTMVPEDSYEQIETLQDNLAL